MESQNHKMYEYPKNLSQISRKNIVNKVGRITVLLWIAGLVFFIIVVKFQQEASLGPLQKAAWNGDVSLVKDLLEQGVSVDNACEFNRWTALHAAAYSGQVEIAEILIKGHANINVKDKDGYTPLHNTAKSFLKGAPTKSTEIQRNQIAALLIEHEALINATTNHGETPLHKAALMNNVGLVQLLLENGADPNIQQAQGMTPLHFAFFAGNDRFQIVRLLVDHGADSSTKDGYGKTPKDYAKEYHPKLLELLN